MKNLSRIVFAIVLLFCLAQAAYFYPLLPERVASHFGPSGQPDAWSSKDFFIKIYLVAIGFIAVLFPSIGIILRRTPTTLMNLPNKDYWLSPERRDQTIDLFSKQFLWFGSATLLLFLDIFHQSFNVALGKSQALEHPITSLVVYVAFSIFWTIGLIAKFRRPA